MAQPIELQVTNIEQLFHTLDPFPFRERDIDREAEDYIVSWASELSAKDDLTIVIHLAAGPVAAPKLEDVEPALKRYFAYKAHLFQTELHELFRIGRRSLLFGLGILVVCLLLARWIAGYVEPSPATPLIRESLLILGWVANWKPIEIFLYDWIPIVRRRNLYRRLADATVAIAKEP